MMGYFAGLLPRFVLSRRIKYSRDACIHCIGWLYELPKPIHCDGYNTAFAKFDGAFHSLVIHTWRTKLTVKTIIFITTTRIIIVVLHVYHPLEY